MNREREGKLLNAITGIRDNIIEQAQEARLRTSRSRWIARAACAVLLVAVGGIIIWKNLLPFGRCDGGGGAGHPEGSSVFMSYAGPVFPLTLSEAKNEISANRHVAYDFSLDRADSPRGWGVQVQDSHLLSNLSDRECSLNALYPFVGNFGELAHQMPTITVNEEIVSPTLHPGGYAGDFTGIYGADDPEGSANILSLDSWEGYKALLENGNYQAGALADYPTLSQPVTVYSFTDFKAPLEKFHAATQAIAFTIDPKRTTVLLYGFNGCEYGEEGWRRFSYFVPQETGRDSEKHIVVIGDDIGEYTLQGYKNGACEKGNELDGVSATVTRTERVFSAVLGDIVDNFLLSYGDGEGLVVSPGMFLGAVSEFMLEYGPLSASVRDRYEVGMIEDIISGTKNLDRVFYLEFPIILPAGGSVLVTASLHKEPSFDFHCSGRDNLGIQGYDLVTRLGSNLQFTEMTAALQNSERIRIIRQNFGFDLENGIDQVVLDPDIPHYYLEIKPVDIEK